MKRRAGFTLIELLVVIAVIAVLMGILMPALNAVREQGKRKSCASQERQHMIALNVYGADYDAKLPLQTRETVWLWNMHYEAVNHLLAQGLTMEMFYCASNKSMGRKDWMEHFFTANGNLKWDGKRLQGSGNQGIWGGYAYVLDSYDGKRRKNRPILADPRGEMQWIRTLNDKRPADSELMVDAILGTPDSGPDYPYGYNFGLIKTGSTYNTKGIWDSSSHLKTDGVPIGGNIAFLDGHVEWRSFGGTPQKRTEREKSPYSIMNVRWESGSPPFWW